VAGPKQGPRHDEPRLQMATGGRRIADDIAADLITPS